MALSPEFLDEIKLRVPCTDVVGRKVKLQRSGRDLKGLCPFHKEKTPSFHCFEDHYHCFGCGAHGSIFDFVMETEGASFREAVEQLAAQAGLPMPQVTREDQERAQRRKSLGEVVEAACQFFERCLYMPEGKEALDYLTGRGLSPPTIKHFRLGFAPDMRGALKADLARQGIDDGMMLEAGLLVQPEDRAREPYDRFRGRAMFPITNRRGEVIAFGARLMKGDGPKYLNSPETPLFHKGRTLYALAQSKAGIRDSGRVIVAEGYMDVIALHQAGMDHAVAPLGTAVTEEQLAELWRLAPDPILCLDGDQAGQRAAARAAERALPIITAGHGLRFAMLPSGEDPDSLVQSQGRAAFEAVLEAALPLSELLWNMESGGALPPTPEARAALDKRLKERLRQVQDGSLRAHLGEMFRARLWPDGDNRGGFGGAHSGKWRGGNWRGGKPAYAGRHTRLRSGGALDATAEQGSILLYLAVTFPALLDEFEEDLGGFVCADPELDRLRQAILQFLSGREVSDSPLDSDGLVDQLTVLGHSHALDRLHAQRKSHARFARPEAGIAEARRGWEEAFSTLRDRDLATEVQEARLRFAEDPSQENSDRLIALMELKQAEEAAMLDG